MWRMRRIPIFEAALIELRRGQVASDKRRDRIFQGPLDRNGAESKSPYENTALALIQDSQNQDTVGKLFRYEAALMNAFNRTLQQLLFLQDRRARMRTKTRSSMSLRSSKLIGCCTAAIGFVS